MHTGLAVTGLHMHIGSGTDLEHLTQVCGAMEKAAREVGPLAHDDQRRRRLADSLSRRAETYVDLDGYFQLWDAAAQAARRRSSATSCGSRSSRAATSWPRAATWSREIRAIKRMGEQHVLSARRRLQQPGPADSVRRVSPDVDVPGAMDRAASGRRSRRGRRRPAVRIGRHLHAGRGRLRASRPLPAAEVGDLLVIEVAGAYGFVMGSNYNSKPLAAEVLIENGRPNWSAAGKRSTT